MIQIYQNKYLISDLKSLFIKGNEVTVKMNRDIIQKDLDRLELLNSEANNKYNKNNIKVLIKYIKKLIKGLNDDDTFEMCWELKDGIPASYPIQLINEPDYELDICNYIEVEPGCKVVSIDTTDIANVIAFDEMYRDLGETQESLEEAFKKCGITIIEKGSIIQDYFNRLNVKPYYLAKTGFKVSSSPYISFETKNIHDYFYSKEFDSSYYRDVVSYSCRAANAVLMKELNTRLTSNNDKNKEREIIVKVLAVNDTNLTFMVSGNAVNSIDLKEIVSDSICIRIFGRRFSFNPNVIIY
jgi:hypothetical protein